MAGATTPMGPLLGLQRPTEREARAGRAGPTCEDITACARLNPGVALALPCSQVSSACKAWKAPQAAGSRAGGCLTSNVALDERPRYPSSPAGVNKRRRLSLNTGLVKVSVWEGGEGRQKQRA